jgi:enamine deaminase RidA (YjgF/YER057c/UK114 family)
MKSGGFSHAVKKTGTPVFIAGELPLDIDGKLVGEDDIRTQMAQVYKNLEAVVEAAGGTKDDIVRITTYTTDLSYRDPIMEMRREFFTPGKMPTSTFLVVAGLARPEYLVEMDAVAVIND